MIKAKFSIGQRVNRLPFTDCFGKFCPPILNMEIVHINRVAYEDRVYFRITAVGPAPITMVEGAERFFELA